MNKPDFREVIEKAKRAAQDRRQARLKRLLSDEFREEIRAMEANNLHTLKSWRIAKEAGLTAHQAEFAEIEAEHTASGKGMTEELRERRRETRQLMWQKLREEFGGEAVAILKERLA